MLLRTIDYIFGTNLTNSTIGYCTHVFQNIACLGVCLYTTTAIVLSNNIMFENVYSLIPLYCGMDFLISTDIEVWIHHVFVISLRYFQVCNNLILPTTQAQSYTSPEISTIFLCLRSLSRGLSKDVRKKYNVLFLVNDVLFMGSFFFTRLYVLPRYLLFDANFATYMIRYTSTTTNYLWFYTSLYSLCGLNLYWGTRIIGKLFNTINIWNYTHAEYLLQYTYFVSPVVSAICYNNYDHYSAFIDIFGQCILSVNSHNYHNKIYNGLKENVNGIVNIYDTSIFKYYLRDIASIHMRSFLCVLTNFLMASDKNINIETGLYMCFSLTNHVTCMYNFIEHLIEDRDSGYKLIYASNDKMIDHMCRIPILMDLLWLFYHNSNSQIANAHVINLSVIIAILTVRPLGTVNHFALHIALLFQSAILSVNNAMMLTI